MLLPNRNGVHVLVKSLEEKNAYAIFDDGYYSRWIGDGPLYEAVDFDGGPMLSVGDTFCNGKIKFIMQIPHGVKIITDEKV